MILKSEKWTKTYLSRFLPMTFVRDKTRLIYRVSTGCFQMQRRTCETVDKLYNCFSLVFGVRSKPRYWQQPATFSRKWNINIVAGPVRTRLKSPPCRLVYFMVCKIAARRSTPKRRWFACKIAADTSVPTYLHSGITSYILLILVRSL